MSLEGQIIGFDEYMNMTLDDAVEIDKKTGKKTNVGRILLKGDAITLLQNANPPLPAQAYTSIVNSHPHFNHTI